MSNNTSYITVREAREKSGKSQEACARYLGLSLGGYRKKEQEPSRFRIDEFALLAQFLGYTFDIFYESVCHKMTQSKATGT